MNSIRSDFHGAFKNAGVAVVVSTAILGTKYLVVPVEQFMDPTDPTTAQESTALLTSLIFGAVIAAKASEHFSIALAGLSSSLIVNIFSDSTSEDDTIDNNNSNILNVLKENLKPVSSRTFAGLGIAAGGLKKAFGNCMSGLRKMKSTTFNGLLASFTAGCQGNLTAVAAGTIGGVVASRYINYPEITHVDNTQGWFEGRRVTIPPENRMPANVENRDVVRPMGKIVGSSVQTAFVTASILGLPGFLSPVIAGAAALAQSYQADQTVE